MNRIGFFAITAITLLAPMLVNAQTTSTTPSLSLSTVKNTIVTKEMVIYEPLTGHVNPSSLKTARLWSDALLAETAKDCAARKGVLNTCASVCGLTGCFSSCSLACEFPNVINASREEIQSEYTKKASELEEISIKSNPNILTGGSKNKVANELRDDLAGLAEKLGRIHVAARTEISLLEMAYAELRAWGYGTTQVPGIAKRLGDINQSLTLKRDGRFKNCTAQTKEMMSTRATPAVNHFSTSSTPLITIECDTQTPDIFAVFGNGNAGDYVYEKGYVIKNGKWERISFAGSSAQSGGWLSGAAQADIKLSMDDDVDGVAMYMCQNISGAWKCGCQDTACTKPKWQVMGLSR